MSAKLRVAVLGATGVAGQQFLAALADHPYFEVSCLAASERTAGKSYAEALRDAAGSLRWYASVPPPPALLELRLAEAAALEPARLREQADVVFSALESDAARQIEPRLAQELPVFSTASAYRYEDDVPILLPGVNLEHAELLRTQQRRRGWRGFIAPGPNCTTVGLTIALKPIAQRFGLERVVMTSLQSVSGAGRSPGVAALDIVDNVVPFIPSEEEKVERETRKILGRYLSEPAAEAAQASTGSPSPALGRIEPLALPMSCTCTRVGVLEGHTETVFCATARPAPLPEVKAAMLALGDELQHLRLPSMPARLIEVSDDPYRPQPRLDRDAGGGMTTVVGRLRNETALGPHGVKFVLVSHNTKMGAAAGSILVAEYLLKIRFFAETFTLAR
jgi:aspartate-semialdehyde dehydrogenase